MWRETRLSQFIEPLQTSNDDLQLLGGKGRSLTHLVNRGFTVPNGFHVTTTAYKHFVKENDLQGKILDAAQPKLSNRRASFEEASTAIQSLFESASVSDNISTAIAGAYTALAEKFDGVLAVAVRSSANAEDLPDLSFAGQQETYLNISGAQEVVRAVKRCWASLWTPQALNYRHQNGIQQDSVAMSVVVQALIPADVAGILFTANPATGERNEMVLNASYGLGESVVSGQITPDTFIVDRLDGSIKESVIGTKELEITAGDHQGTSQSEVSEDRKSAAVLSDNQIKVLWETAEQVLQAYDNLPLDIEWAIRDGALYLLQARPITNLPVQPIEINWDVPAPATYVSRRQIVENMPDPICPLFEELYLTEGLESTRKGVSLMVGGGPMFITVNGYAYQRFDFKMVHDQAREKGLLPVEDAAIDVAELAAEKTAADKGQAKNDIPAEARRRAAERRKQDKQAREKDVDLFREDLSESDRADFDAWRDTQPSSEFATALTMPKSENPTYIAFNNSEWNDRQTGEWFEVTRPRLESVREKWRKVDPESASDSELLSGIREMGIEEGYYWSSNSSHSFGVAKSTDDQLQSFLRETLPDHHFISGQFLSGIESKTMQANADLFEIAQEVRKNDSLALLLQVTPTKFVLDALKHRNDSKSVLDMVDAYLATYGHQGYSLDFVEATQLEDPAAIVTTLKAMVADDNYHPDDQAKRAQQTREEKFAEISEILDGLEYWQFRFRLWLARKYHFIREEVAYMFGYTWVELRQMALELGSRLSKVGTLQRPDDVFYLVTEELELANNARSRSEALPELGEMASRRRELREARKRHHPPGTLPAEASQIGGIAFKETQIKNEADSAVMRGFPVSSGTVTAPASVITGAADFEKMEPGSILVSPLTTPAWTQLFAHAVGLVTDVGSILAHGSIVAREYGIPAVLGVGDGTKRIKHGQVISIDGDQGTVLLHSD